eukprot:1085133-Pelagomonas_calceolata.AAC.3
MAVGAQLLGTVTHPPQKTLGPAIVAKLGCVPASTKASIQSFWRPVASVTSVQAPLVAPRPAVSRVDWSLLLLCPL